MDQGVSRAVGVLEVLARAGAPVRLVRIAEAAGLQKSTAHRLLRTWVQLGYVEQEPESGRYSATLRLWELGSAVLVEHPLKRAAAGFLHALQRETDETVSLLLADGDDVLYLDKLFSPRSMAFSTRPGSRVSAILTAGGKAILATDHNIAERLRGSETLLTELAAIRQRGYSRSVTQAGAVSFGCALPSRAGQASAAISVSVPRERLDDAAEARIVQALLSTCAKLAESLGSVDARR